MTITIAQHQYLNINSTNSNSNDNQKQLLTTSIDITVKLPTIQTIINIIEEYILKHSLHSMLLIIIWWLIINKKKSTVAKSEIVDQQHKQQWQDNYCNLRHNHQATSIPMHNKYIIIIEEDPHLDKQCINFFQYNGGIIN